MNSLEEMKFETKEVDRSGLIALDEARESGVATLNKLEAQGEAIDKYEGIIDSNQYLIDKSGRIIRGMTWWGWIQNKFTSGPALPDPRTRIRSLDKKDNESDPSNFCHDRNEESCFSERKVSREQAEYLQSLSFGLDELLQVGSAIGSSAERQNEAIPHLQEKIDRLWDSTTHVTRQAGRVHEGYGKRATPKFLCHIALREKKSGLYVSLGSEGDLLLLTQNPQSISVSCRFALYEKRAHLLGLQSTVNRKYIGITFAGTLKCQSNSFGRWEELFLDLTRPLDSPMLAVAANWGSGCWLDLRPFSSHAKNHRTSLSKLVIGSPRTSPHALKVSPRFELIFLDDDYERLNSSGQQFLFLKRNKNEQQEVE